MSVYLESNGTPRAATFGEVRDLFVEAVKTKRDEILQRAEDGEFDVWSDPRWALSNEIITGVLGIIEGNSPYCPAFSLVPKVTEEDKCHALEAGGNWIPCKETNEEDIDISDGIIDYFQLVNT